MRFGGLGRVWLTEDEVQWRILVKMEVDSRFPRKSGNLLTRWATVSFSRISIRVQLNVSYAFLTYLLALQPNAGQGHLILEVSRSHAMTQHSRKDSSGRRIGQSQRPLPDNTQHLQWTDVMLPAGFETAVQASDRPQTLALDRSATGMSCWSRKCCN